MPTVNVGPSEKEINRCGMAYTDRVALITGGSAGIGDGIVRVFVDAGAKVVTCARGAEAGVALAGELSQKRPGTCRFERCDVSKPEQIRRLIDRTIELHGRLDCLVNNAGYHPPAAGLPRRSVSFACSWRAMPHPT